MELAIYQANDKYLVLSPTNVDWFVTNTEGITLVKHYLRCFSNPKGTLNIEQLSINKETRGNTSCLRILEILEQWNYRDKHSKNRESTIQRPILKTVYLNLTNRCNLSCKYCFAAERKPNSKELTFLQYKQLITEINAMCGRPPNLVFTGGEPLLSSFALNLARFAKDKGNEIALLTNGTLINQSNAEKIARLFYLVKISLDGTTLEVHERHRGAGSFFGAKNAIDLLKKYDANLEIASTITSVSIDEVSLLAKEYGRLVKFAPFFPNVGRGRENSDFCISGIEYYKALISDERINPLGKNSIDLLEMKKHRCSRCAMGHEQISIDSDGSVYPCQLLHTKDFFAGSIFETPIKEIYYNSSVLTNIRKVDVDNIEGCSTCDFRYLCAGGCRGRAYWDSGSVNVAGKFCDYEINALLDGMFRACERPLV
jgi:radical SAM protein with 4Fe4S-binding SPASM domain